jgi:hypothetical protein
MTELQPEIALTESNQETVAVRRRWNASDVAQIPAQVLWDFHGRELLDGALVHSNGAGADDDSGHFADVWRDIGRDFIDPRIREAIDRHLGSVPLWMEFNARRKK